MSICAGWRRHWSMWSMCSRLVHLDETLILTIDNTLLDLLQASSFVPSWHSVAQLSYNPAQTWGRKIMDDDDISIYTPEELERLESLWVREFVHTLVYDVNLLKKGEMDVNLPTLFRIIGWSLWWDFWEVYYWWRGSDGSSTRWRYRKAQRRCCVPPSTHRPASSTTSSVNMASNLMLKSCKDLSLGE
jgi:hypothetical protein